MSLLVAILWDLLAVFVVLLAVTPAVWFIFNIADGFYRIWHPSRDWVWP